MPILSRTFGIYSRFSITLSVFKDFPGVENPKNQEPSTTGKSPG